MNFCSKLILSIFSPIDIDGEHVTKGKEIDKIDYDWATHNCTLTFETLGVWPEQADGTDINSSAVTSFSDGVYVKSVLAVSNDFGTVRVYKYPCNQPSADYIELLGHSAHVTGLTFLQDHGRLISAGGREVSIIQRTPITSNTE